MYPDCIGMDKRRRLHEYPAEQRDDLQIHEEVNELEWISQADFIHRCG